MSYMYAIKFTLGSVLLPFLLWFICILLAQYAFEKKILTKAEVAKDRITMLYTMLGYYLCTMLTLL